MKPEQFSSTANLNDNRSLVRRFCLLGGAGAMGGALVLFAFPAGASTEGDGEVLIPVESVPESAPVETSAEALLTPQVTVTPAVEPATVAPLPLSTTPPATTTPQTAGSIQPVAPPPVVEQRPSLQPQPEAATADGDSRPLANSENVESVFIDPTDYSLGATPSPESPAVIFSNRSTGCEFTLEQGQPAFASDCGAQVSAGTAALAAGVSGPANTSATHAGVSLGPVTIGRQGVTVGGTTVISREYFNQKLRPLNLLRQNAEEFVFPLSIPAPITSLFGWREHPIFGDRRFHTGTDIGAPEGTPVLATKDGEVQVADYLGGYGYTVILHHENGTQETRYAHLARILVQPGEQVKQGEIVGLVGSTGNSTGPHLHFELRELTASGWMLANPDELMNYTVVSLVDAINNPLRALGLASGPAAEETADPEAIGLDLPYRPAQPNAS